MTVIREFDFVKGPETTSNPTPGDPATDIDPVSRFFANNNYVPGSPSVADLAALSAVAEADRANGHVRLVVGQNALYRFNSAASDAEDSPFIIEPDAGSGRWFMVDAKPQNADFPTVISLAEQAIGEPGDAGQIMQGHVLDSDSFDPGLTAANLSFYNLASASDNSSNSRDLTNVGTVPFTGADIFNASRIASFNGTDQSFTSSNAFFDITSTLSAGCWFYATDTSSQAFILNNFSPTGNNRSWGIYHTNAGLLNVILNETGSSGANDIFNVMTIDENKWYHIAFTYRASTDNLKVYVNGGIVLDVTATTDVLYSNGGGLAIGARTDGTDPFQGRVQDAFVYDGILSNFDIAKIAASRVPVSPATSPEKQWLTSIWDGKFQLRPEFYIVSQTSNNVYMDLSGFDATDLFEMRAIANGV